MRRFALASAFAALSLAAAGPALAVAPVEITIGPELAKKTASYGARDIDLVRKWLSESATKTFSKPGAAQIVRADLVLENAVPNRPTFSQMSRYPQLSMWSVGLGGATIGGTVTTTDGQVHPIKYGFYESNFWNLGAASTWRDAERAFDNAARRIAKGDFPNQKRPMQPTGNGSFDPRNPYN